MDTASLISEMRELRFNTIITIPWLAPVTCLLSEFENGEEKTGGLVYYFY